MSWSVPSVSSRSEVWPVVDSYYWPDSRRRTDLCLSLLGSRTWTLGRKRTGILNRVSTHSHNWKTLVDYRWLISGKCVHRTRTSAKLLSTFPTSESSSLKSQPKALILLFSKRLSLSTIDKVAQYARQVSVLSLCVSVTIASERQDWYPLFCPSNGLWYEHWQHILQISVIKRYSVAVATQHSTNTYTHTEHKSQTRS